MARIRFEHLTVGRISHSSGIFSGDNRPCKWTHTSKVNEGFGSISGENNQASGQVNIVINGSKISSGANGWEDSGHSGGTSAQGPKAE